jgi:hypothetical protein
MSWLGSLGKTGGWLGSMWNNAGNALGSVQDLAKNGINTVSDAAKSVGSTLSNNADKLDGVGLGGTARYAGSALQSGGELGNSIANLVGSKSLNEAIGHGVNSYKKGLKFAGDVMNYGDAAPKSPLQR